MFCPKCAAQNIDGASFCRACGANISLVPQALTGQLPTAEQRQWSDYSSRRRRNREPSIEEAIRSIIMGVAFTIVSILVSRYAPGGSVWWFWLLIPAFGCFAKGFSELARVRMAKGSPQNAQPHLNSVRPPDLPAPRTGELMTPVPSVTESTTRHLSEAHTQHRDSNQQQRPS
jgi:hypothetical protein